MKQLLTALLILIYCGCKGQPPPEINPNKVQGNGSFALYPQTNERLWTIVKLPIIRLKPHDGMGEALDTARKIGYWQSIMLHHNYYRECTIRMYDGTWIVSENPQLALEEMYQIIKSYERMMERLRKSLKPQPSPLPDTVKPIKDSGVIDLGDMEWHCLVAHCNEDGCFTCDYHEHYFPYEIYNDSIKKWFIKMIGKDSMFYYRHADDTSNYIWNGDKNDECGYDLKYNGEVVSSICVKYNGHDTIQIINQVWNEYQPTPKPFSLPDTTKPLNIKMQPRNRIDIDSIRWGDGMTSNTTISGDSTFSLWSDVSQSSRGETFTIKGVPDTARYMLLVIDTLSTNGFRSNRCFWMYGWGVTVPTHRQITADIWQTSETKFLDSDKIPLKKNIIVWLSKELK